jgi:hypothetical protein
MEAICSSETLVPNHQIIRCIFICLFVLNLFNEDISKCDCMGLCVRIIVNNELEGTWKEVVIT